MRQNELDNFYFFGGGRESALHRRVDPKTNNVTRGVRIAKYKPRETKHRAVLPRDEM